MHMWPGRWGVHTPPELSQVPASVNFPCSPPGSGAGGAKQALMCYKAQNSSRAIRTTQHRDPCHEPERFLIDRVPMRETKSFSWRLFPVIIYSQMQERSVLKTGWKAARLLLEHDLFLCVFSCTCRLQQKTRAFPWICNLQEQQKPTEEWVGSVPCTQTPPGSVLL